MKCPACKTTLTRIDYEGMPICTCLGCQGEFVDLSRLRRIEKQREIQFDEAEARQAEKAASGPLRGRQLICPRCGNLMAKKRYRHTDVVIDYCKACRGIWLDDQELERIQILGEAGDDTREAQAAFAARMAGARAAALEGRGESTEGQGYEAGASSKLRSMTVPKAWVRAILFFLFGAVAIAWYTGLVHTFIPVERLLNDEILQLTDTLIPAGSLFFALLFAFTYTKVDVEPKAGLTVTRFALGIPWRRRYDRKELASIGTDNTKPGFMASLLLDILLTGRHYWLRSHRVYEPQGRNYVYIVLKSGKRICIYKGGNDSFLRELCDFLQSNLGLGVRRL